MTHVVKNHCISAEVLAAGPHDAKMLLDTINIILKKNPAIARGCEIKGGWETSPARKQALRSFFEARDWIKGLNPSYAFEECARSWELWDDTRCVKVGWHCKEEQEWKWDIAVAATIGARATPRPGEPAEAAADQEAEAKDDDMQDDAKAEGAP